MKDKEGYDFTQTTFNKIINVSVKFICNDYKVYDWEKGANFYIAKYFYKVIDYDTFVL